MRIVFLTKRHYTAKDLLADRYGRYYEIPKGLAALGHRVTGICTDYRGHGGVSHFESDGVEWYCGSARKRFPLGLAHWLWRVDGLLAEFPPDVIVAGSDVFQVMLGSWLARRSEVAFISDLYDNYESFAAARLPGARSGFRRAVRAARAVSCVSRRISELVGQGYGYHGPIEVVENAIPAGIFYPRDRNESRRMLGLPEDAKLVGVAGAISASRGIGVLFQGCARLALRLPDLNLVIAGPRDGSVCIPRDARTHDLGILPLEQVPVLLSALDLAVICNLDSAFGRYSFPQKFHEIIACGTPVLAAAVGALAERLAPWPQCLYVPDDDASLAQTMQVQLEDPQRPTIVPPRWEDMARRLERLVGEVN